MKLSILSSKSTRLLLCLVKPLESFSHMDPVIVVWCFHTKLAVSWYSAPVILSINHFTYKFTNGEIIADAIFIKPEKNPSCKSIL